jgi:5-dehydro-2-deoxygluconokinase
MNLGYGKDLFILPFDHRTSFLKNMFGIENRDPSEEEIEKIKQSKEIIYQGFKMALTQDLPKESAAILLDEEFGDKLLRDAHENGYTIILTVEKSGQKEFDFQYNEDFGEHIKKYDPVFVKALIHYNPEGDRGQNSRQREKLSELTKFCHENGYKLLIEPLIPATVEQLARCDGDPDKYDKTLRPLLTVRMIKELQNGSVDPDVWKLEGMAKEEDYQMAVAQARAGGRNNVGIVILGRAAEPTVVENWLKTGAKLPGIIGFAVGRTIFWDPITSFKDGKIEANEAAELISKRFLHYYHIFIEARQGL